MASAVLCVLGMRTQADILKDRTFRFAQNIVAFVRELPAAHEGRRLGAQLLDSGTSVAANYRAACRARSHAEFVAKIGLVVEEADETEFWLELIAKSSIAPEAAVTPLRDEAYQLTAIFTASHRTASLRKRERR